MLTTFNEVDMKPIMDLRSKYKDQFKEKYGVGLGFMSFFTRAICVALKDFPTVNASIDKDEIIYHDYCDISIAVSTPRGLVVPVIRNAESLSMPQIESEVVRLATKGRDGKLSIEEMTGGTFSITNPGIYGGLMGLPVINQPNVAILGIGAIQKRPMVIDDAIAVRSMVYLTLSYDHRVVDGAIAHQFVGKVKAYLENWSEEIL